MKIAPISFFRGALLFAVAALGSQALAQAPTITSVTPMSGPERRNVTITGTGFSGTGITSRLVLLNGTNVGSLSVSATRLIFTVPIGATSGPITVQTNLGSVSTATSFVLAGDVPPANDAFANAQLLSGASGAYSGTTANATREAGEPIHANDGGGASVWFTWTAPSSGLFLFNPHDSTATNFGVDLAIYTGTALDSLTRVASGSANMVFSRFASAAVLNATAGTTYSIAIDGYMGIMGDFRLTWSPLAAPAISGFTPGSGYSGQSVTITGANFAPGAQVTIGGVQAASNRVTVGSPTSITVSQVPFGAPVGSSAIVVTTAAGAAISAANFTVVAPPAPTIASFSPASGGVGTSVAITGTALSLGDGPVTVSFNGTPANKLTIINTGSLSVPVPLGATSGPITVQTAGGSATTSSSFEVTSSSFLFPFIFGFSPGTAAAGDQILITGQNLTGATVSFNGVPASVVSIDPLGQSMTVTVPVGAPSGPLIVTNPAGSATSDQIFTPLVAAPPIITSFSPTAFQPGQAVTIFGTNLVSVSSVLFNGVPAAYVVDSPTQITATAPMNLSTGPITVVTAGGTVSSSQVFTVGAGPTITSISPLSGPVGRNVTITGTNFMGSGITSRMVLVNGTPVRSLSASATRLVFTVPTGATSGPITVVTNVGSVTLPSLFMVGAGPAPANDNFGNAQPLAGASGVCVGNTANATKEPGEPNHAGDAGGASVWFSWVAPSSGPYLFNPHDTTTTNFGVDLAIYTGTALTNLTPVASGSSGISFSRFQSATVLNATAGTTYFIALDGYAGVMGDFRLTWSPVATPTVTSFTPGSAYAGQQVVILGAGFVPGAAVSFGGVSVAAAKLSYTSATQITVTQLPPDAVSGPVTVATPGGTATSSATFLVAPAPAPVITSVSPTSGFPGASVLISGTALSLGGATPPTVLFNGVPVTTFTAQTSTSLAVKVPGGATSGFITVQTTQGAASSPTPFTVLVPPPAVTGFSPTRGPAGTRVTFTGTSLNQINQILFHGAQATFTIDSPTQITAIVPATATSGAVTFSDGQVIFDTADPFTVTNPPATPTITGFSPSVAVGGGSVVITGTNFIDVYGVTFNGIGAGYHLDSPTQITAYVPADPGTSGPIEVRTAAGSVVSTTNFVYGIAPVIAGQPLTTLVTFGQPTSLTVVASSNLPVQYQWRRDGMPVLGNPTATTATLSIPSATMADTGLYDCVVTNVAGSATSNGAFLAVKKAVASLTLSGLSATYDGLPHAVTATSTPAGLTVRITYDGVSALPVDAGGYAVQASVEDPNYTGSANGTLVIGKAMAAIRLENLNVTYDGTPKPVAAVTTPERLACDVAYSGTPTPPTNAGSYPVTATINDRNYTGSATGTLVVAKAAAEIELSGLRQSYSGDPRPVTAATQPAGLNVVLRYDGGETAPSTPGNHAVAATVEDENYAGSRSDTLTITTTALVRHASTLDGEVDGSLQITTAENFTVNGNGFVSGDVLVPGMPTVRLNGHATFVGVRDGNGSAMPADSQVTLNGGATLRYLVRRTDPIPMPGVTPPPVPAGTRDVVINGAGQGAGDFATLRSLTLNSGAGSLVVPEGTYGSFTVNSGASLVLGVAGSPTPTVYNLQRLVLNRNAHVEIAGPVILNIATGIALNGDLGSKMHPEWLSLTIATGGLTLDGNTAVHGVVIAPNGTVTLNGNSSLHGRVIADRLTVNGNGLLEDAD